MKSWDYDLLKFNVSRLAQALQMKLLLRDQKGKFSIHGTQKFSLPVSEEFSIDLDLKIEASTATPGFASILFHVVGDLWGYLYFEKLKALHVFLLLDGTRAGITKTTASAANTLDLNAIVKAFGKGVVGMYHREAFKREWTKVNDGSDLLDEGHGASPDA